MSDPGLRVAGRWRRDRLAARDGCPLDFTGSLAFLARRSLPGVELIDANRYLRLAGSPERPLTVRVSKAAGGLLSVDLRGGDAASRAAARAAVWRMFDLDVDTRAMRRVLGADPVLAPLLAAHPGLRLPGGWDGFEVVLRAVLGQQVSVAAGVTLTGRLVERCGRPLPLPVVSGLERLAPRPADVLAADLSRLGVPAARAATLTTVARAVLDGNLTFEPGQELDDFVARCCALPGIGPWTAHYVALRALGHGDAFPAGDLVLRKALSPPGKPPITAAAAERRAEAWRPWRAYAVVLLWRAATAGAAAAG